MKVIDIVAYVYDGSVKKINIVLSATLALLKYVVQIWWLFNLFPTEILLNYFMETLFRMGVHMFTAICVSVVLNPLGLIVRNVGGALYPITLVNFS